MIAFVCVVVLNSRRDNVTFRVMNAWPQDFEDDFLDLVNGHFLGGFLDKASWSRLVAVCLRILKAGGILLFSE